ncbi:MAG: hypothetical protein KC445_21320, partial [Anaerolineales bacterium]|nr:hypothetical protein [Anaerolineales bacterium]
KCGFIQFGRKCIGFHSWTIADGHAPIKQQLGCWAVIKDRLLLTQRHKVYYQDSLRLRAKFSCDLLLWYKREQPFVGLD